MVLEYVPDALVDDHIVDMDEDVAEIDDLSIGRDRRRDLGRSGQQPPESFSDDDELSLDAGTEQRVGPVIGQGPSRDEFEREPTRLFDVEEILECIKLHRPITAPWRWH